MLRLEGFTSPWDTAVYKGRSVDDGSALADCINPPGEPLITVRRVLVPEGDQLSLAFTVFARPTCACQRNVLRSDSAVGAYPRCATHARSLNVFIGAWVDFCSGCQLHGG